MTGGTFLRPGQIIKIIDALYRVDYVNECRARVTPLTKRHVVLDDGSEFDAAHRTLNISPRSCVGIVTDLDRAKVELELAATERELKRLVREAAQAAAQAAAPPPPPPPPKAPSTRPVRPTSGAGWQVGPTPAPPFKAGTLAAETFALITTTPGLTTRQIVETVKTRGAVAACVSRFFQAGYIERRP